MAYSSNGMAWSNIDKAYAAAKAATCDVWLLWREPGEGSDDWKEWSLWDDRCGIAGGPDDPEREMRCLGIARMMDCEWQVCDAEGNALDDNGNWLAIA